MLPTILNVAKDSAPGVVNIDMIDSIVPNNWRHLDVIEIRNPAFNNYNGLQYFVHFFKNEMSNVDNSKCLNVFKRLFKSMLNSKFIKTKNDLVDYNDNSYEKIDCRLIESLINIINANNNRYDNNSNPNIELQEWIEQLYFMYKNKQFENVVTFILENRYSEFETTIDKEFVCPIDGKSVHLMKQQLQTDLSNSDKRVDCMCMACNEMINEDATKSMYQCQADEKHIICKQCCIVKFLNEWIRLRRLFEPGDHDLIFMKQQIGKMQILKQMVAAYDTDQPWKILFDMCINLWINPFFDKFVEVVPKDYINKVLGNKTLMHWVIYHKKSDHTLITLEY